MGLVRNYRWEQGMIRWERGMKHSFPSGVLWEGTVDKTILWREAFRNKL